ncbi:MAG: M48 family metallopeptidase [Bacteroidota bacterium]
MFKKVILLTLTGVIAYSCATVPVTGRRQLNLINNSEILPMSYDQYEQVLGESKLSDNQEWTAMVKRSGEKIKIAAEQYMKDIGAEDQLEGYDWTFNLIESETVNAWCMPGGKVAFYTGIMPICATEDGVAVVMGHEVAHAIANHSRERMSQSMVTNGLGSALGTAMGSDPTLTQAIFMQSVGIGSQLGMLKFSRTHESEADKIGLIFMAIAGYNPQEAPRFWQRMNSNAGGERPPEFLSTHPNPDTRIDDLNAAMPEALKYYKK